MPKSDVFSRVPYFNQRIKALIIDYAVNLFLITWTLSVFSDVEIHTAIKVFIIVCLLIFPDAFLVSFSGGTLGQKLLGLRVQDNVTGLNLNLFSSFMRVLSKLVAGLPAFVFMLMTSKDKALHDIISGSVIVQPNQTDSKSKRLTQRGVDVHGFRRPSWYRRLAIVIVYNLVCFLLLGSLAASTGYFSDDCIDLDICSQSEEFAFANVGSIFVVLAFIILIFGWKGKLYGARRLPIDQPPDNG